MVYSGFLSRDLFLSEADFMIEKFSFAVQPV